MIAVEETIASQRRRSIAIYAGIVVALAVFAAASVWQGMALVADIALQNRVASVIKQSNALLLALDDAETGQRGYLLTGNERYLQPYLKGKEVAASSIEKLIESAHTLSQFGLLRTIQRDMRDKIDELDATVRLRREGRLEEALAIVKTDAGKEYMDRLRSGIGSFVTDCEMRRSEALKDSESRIQATGYAFIGLLLGIAALLASTAAMQAKGYRGLLRGTKRIAREALRDSLTGLSNRRDLARRLEEMQVSGEATQSVTALFIDLDGFKAINDKLGHAVGDALLRRVSESLRRITRSGDTLARVGGDEFVVIAPGLSDHSAIEKLCDRLVAEICLLQTAYGKVGLSIGIATQRSDDLVIEELLQEADKAMYDAKRSGGGYRFAMSLDAALV